MSVHLLPVQDGLFYDPIPGAPALTLFGKPFPPDDVKAYWSLVPVPISVEWKSNMSLFVVQNMISVDREPCEHVVIRTIMATDAHKLDVWMDTIARLVNVAY